MCLPCKHSFKKSPPDHLLQLVSPDSYPQSCFCQTSCQFYKGCQKSANKFGTAQRRCKDYVHFMCRLCT